MREDTPFEAQLRMLLGRLSAIMAHDTDKITALAELQSSVYVEIDTVIKSYIQRRDAILVGYDGHKTAGDATHA